jgi:Flp pilus assembly protein TadD
MLTNQPEDSARNGGLLPARRCGVLVVAACSLLILSACATSAPEPLPAPVPEPVSPEVLSFAEQAIEQGRHGDAKLLLERLLLAEPNNARARLGMAEVQLAFGQVEAAAEGFKQLTRVTPVAARAHQGFGIAMLYQGREEEAHQALRQAIDLDPALWRSWNTMGSLYDRSGGWDKAIDCYDRALEIKPDAAMVYNNRGFSHLLRRDAVAAIADFDKALQLDPNLAASRENLRLAFAWSGNYEEAMVGVGRAKLGQAYNNIGFVALLRGDLASAETYLLRSMEADASFNRIANKNLEYLKNLKAINAKKMEGQG